MPYPIAAVRGRGGHGVATTILPQNLLVSSGTLLEGFENAADWTGSGGTFAADTTHVKEGTQSLALTNNDNTARYRDKAISWDLSATAKLAWWVYIDDLAKLSTFTVFLSSTTDYSKYFVYSVETTTLALCQTGWNYIVVRPSQFTPFGGESWANTMIRIRIRMQSVAGQIVTVSWDDMRDSPEFQPAILLSFDDGLASVSDAIQPYMTSKGMVGTAYIISGLVGTAGYMTSANLVTLDAAGWDLGNHSDDPDAFTTLTQGEIETNIAACNTALDGWGVGDAKLHLAYPQGLRDADSDAAMATQGMLTGRLATSGAGFYMPALNYWHRMPIVSILSNALTLAAAKTAVDTIIANQVVGHIIGHKLGAVADATTWVTADFEDLIDYIAAAGVPVLLISQLHALRSGPLVI